MPKWFIYWIGKLVVRLHYEQKLDIYSLCSMHVPAKYKRAHRKLNVPKDIRWTVWRRDSFACVYCSSNEHPLTIDHLIPEASGGGLGVENLVSACENCNNRKANKPLELFLKERWLKKKRTQNRQRLSTITETPMNRLTTGRQLISKAIGHDDW